MKKTIITCDICGKEIKIAERYGKVFISEISQLNAISVKLKNFDDVCNNCKGNLHVHIERMMEK